MKKLLIIFIFLIPVLTSAQEISLKRLLALQKERLIEVQDFLDSNSWSLSRTVSVSYADSAFWQLRVNNILDSLRKLKFQKPLNKKENFNLTLLKTYNPDAPLYLIYFPTNENSNAALKVNDFTIRFANESLFQSLALGIDNYWSQTFYQSIEITYKGQDPKYILKQIAELKIPKDSSYIVYQDPTVKRVYMYKDQVITITTFDLNKASNFERTYSIEIYSKSNYLFLNDSELSLKGKNDMIQ